MTFQCECNPCWFDHCECFYDCVYDPDGLMEIPEEAEEAAAPPGSTEEGGKALDSAG